MIELAPGIQIENTTGMVIKNGETLGHISTVTDPLVRAAWVAWLTREGK